MDYLLPRRNPQEFWDMRADEFNKWRRENDFPRILDFFKKKVGGFSVWMKEYDISDDIIISLKIADLISDENLSYINCSQEEGKEEYYFVSPIKWRAGAQYGPEKIFKVKYSKEFLPFVRWAKLRKILKNDSSIRITSVSAYPSPEYCISYLLYDLSLLKLGGLPTPLKHSLSGRDLEFVDLDFLKFEGEFEDYSIKDIKFSSARCWEINSAQLHFFNFLNSKIEGIKAKNSELDSWWIKHCYGSDNYISNTIMTRCSFGPGDYFFYLKNVDLKDSDIARNYMKIGEHGFEPNLELIRLMKNAFAENGQHSKAGQFYYYEKYIERKISLNYFKHFFSLFLKFEKSDVLDKKSFKLRNSIRMLWKSIKKLFSYTILTLQWLWWGFGEKPSRTIFMSLGIIILGAIFISLTHKFDNFSIWDPIYFSVVSFLTVGDYSFQPQGITRLIVSILALLGILNLGLLVAGFVNKSKY